MARPSRRYEDLTPARRRRLEAVLLARSVIVGVLLFVAYYLLPLDKPEDFGVALLVGGLVVVAAVVVWQVRAIQNSPFPRLIPLLLVVLAAMYYLTGQARADSFTQPMDKIDAMSSPSP